MKAFLITVSCLGCTYRFTGLHGHSFDAWLVASDLYPQADRITVKPMGGAACA